MQLIFYTTKVSVTSVTNTITSIGSYLGWSCVSKVLVYLNRVGAPTYPAPASRYTNTGDTTPLRKCSKNRDSKMAAK
jgi:hypothetical protein